MCATRSRPFVFAAVLGLAVTVAFGDEKSISGRVVEADGSPVANAEVSTSWYIDEETGKLVAGPSWYTDAETGELTSSGPMATAADGSFAGKINCRAYGVGLLAMNAERTRGGFLSVDESNVSKPLTIQLDGLGQVRGRFTCTELGHPPELTDVTFNALPSLAQVARCISSEAKFWMKLPYGTYKLRMYGTDVRDHHQTIEISPDRLDIDLGTIDLKLTIIAQHYGKLPPAWSVSDARGVSRDVKLSDYRGKWVLLEFWGYW